MGMIRGVSVCRERKHSAQDVFQCEVTLQGIVGDVHFGMSKCKHISMLPYDPVKAYFSEKKEEIQYGRFGENLVVDGIDWNKLQEGQKLCSGSVWMEILQIGAESPASKAYHGPKVCAPMEPYFIFCRVLQGGILRAQEPIEIIG